MKCRWKSRKKRTAKTLPCLTVMLSNRKANTMMMKSVVTNLDTEIVQDVNGKRTIKRSREQGVALLSEIKIR